MSKETELCKLAFKYKSDKCLKCGGRHSYTPYYYSLFKRRKKSVKKVLEFGIETGASLYMWRDFFPNAKIYGADYRSETLINEGRIESILSDQRRPEHLKSLIGHIGSDIDLVIDDASHRPQDQVYTCLKLMPLLQNSVVYVIEDVSDPRIIERLKTHDAEIPKLEKARNRFDNRLVVVRHQPSL